MTIRADVMPLDTPLIIRCLKCKWVQRVSDKDAAEIVAVEHEEEEHHGARIEWYRIH